MKKARRKSTVDGTTTSARTTSPVVSEERLFVLGGKSRGGTYVLRIHVDRQLSMAFGNFKRGKRIPVSAGEYCYIGSALCEKGATCLAKRLIRHATRLGDHSPHPIRAIMLTEFSRLGLGEGDLRPKAPKKPKWNVDHLLDRSTVKLVAAYLIRSSERIEPDLGKWLENDPATVVFEKGLGANDIPGNTHLLRVEADEAWWQKLPARLTDRFLQGKP